MANVVISTLRVKCGMGGASNTHGSYKMHTKWYLGIKKNNTWKT